MQIFDTIEELRAALVEFATRYNETWVVARHGYRTPAKVRADQCRIDQNATAQLKLACLNIPSRMSQHRAAVQQDEYRKYAAADHSASPFFILDFRDIWQVQIFLGAVALDDFLSCSVFWSILVRTHIKIECNLCCFIRQRDSCTIAIFRNISF